MFGEEDNENIEVTLLGLDRALASIERRLIEKFRQMILDSETIVEESKPKRISWLAEYFDFDERIIKRDLEEAGIESEHRSGRSKLWPASDVRRAWQILSQKKQYAGQFSQDDSGQTVRRKRNLGTAVTNRF